QVDESQRLKQLTQPLYDKYVKSVEEKKSSEEDIVVVIEGGKAGEEVIATKEGYLTAKGAVGFKLGSITSITKMCVEYISSLVITATLCDTFSILSLKWLSLLLRVLNSPLED
ncbi:unnamed protein product, partial [Oppiella nova]